MMVARHEMPGKSTDTIRPVGNGVIRGTGVVHRPRPYEALATYHTVPYGTGLIVPRFQAFHAWLPSSRPYGTETHINRLQKL
jgi:hypothetical protein